MTSPSLPIKFKLDLARLRRLIDRNDSELGDAFVSDLEDELHETLSPEAKKMAIKAFECGYACALQAITKMLEV